MTATAIRTYSSSIRLLARTRDRSRAHPGPLPQRRQGSFPGCDQGGRLDKTFYGQGVAVGDYDNDNDPDIYVTAVGRGYLFRNDGKGHFEDVTERPTPTGPTAGSPARHSLISRTTATSTCSSQLR